ncbi:SMI1/KNR4 family protein [Micromonospora chersina]|uniref:SMI1/KNR4 family protein n=1 Tax=Micromonospora chersina TaxID=47854 RepID=UPI0036BF45D4
MTVSRLAVRELRDLLDRITRTHGCCVLPQAGGAVADRGHRIPDDLREFYKLCGGAWLFRDGPHQWRVCGPDDLVPASPRLLTEAIAREIETEAPEDLTNGCYIMADGGGEATDPHVVIDLHPTRSGHCYLVSWDTYGLVGEMPIVATSVPELLGWLLSTDGANPTFAPTQGDAYDQA